ncbi:MAG: hypothetical protein E6K72_01270, partial [Candidatus Eisenbacteria bacterium]
MTGVVRTAARGRPQPHRCVPLLLLTAAGTAGAEWLRPDPSYQQAELTLRFAVHDTAGHASDPAQLDTLGVALLRLGRQADAD